MPSLTWEQVHTWRLTQHFLLERADRQHMLDVVTRIGGLHAQLMSAAGVKDGIEAEASRLGAFLGSPVELSYVE